VVAPPGESVEADDLQAFVTNGRQGVNYRPGTWHMPLIAFDTGQAFLVIDRGGDAPNCDEHTLERGVLLLEP
jgi:ureidoglycolate lyase